jgi:hypothetical protein
VIGQMRLDFTAINLKRNFSTEKVCANALCFLVQMRNLRSKFALRMALHVPQLQLNGVG